MSDDRNNRAVPTGRLGRLLGMGGMAASIGAGVAFSSARQLLNGRPPSLSDLLLAPANALRVADQLSHMRGAAMKLGQLLSMDAGQILPGEWSTILARLQADASPMPRFQLEQQLVRQWGRGWRDRFDHFEMAPVAAASIGQVHRATTRSGRDLAIKVQYPGIAASIDSDIDNVVALLRLSRLIPPGVSLDALVAEARLQLQQEADYLGEADHLTRYAGLVAGDPTLLVPEVDSELTGPGVLAMTFIDSEPIDWVIGRPQAERNRIAERLIRLTLQEVFDFGVIQTDPNFANFRYQKASGRLVLLDFGATRTIPAELTEKLRLLLRAALARDRAGQTDAMVDIGYFAPGRQRLAQLALDLLAMGMDAVMAGPMFDFVAADLPRRARDRALSAGFGADLWSIPPVDTLFIHRKIGGMYLLASRLGATVDVRGLLEEFAGSHS
ncbi:ABC1 kinase family protein [Devosia beringensis]|uniref:ABC1 kinase family protein n=1 Tax=Devosia beringensis TaxID=2657486 RepID=UPI00186B6C59|nr:AarF/ABC1/UbiB kinase family protein [Devosia beringensis]